MKKPLTPMCFMGDHSTCGRGPLTTPSCTCPCHDKPTPAAVVARAKQKQVKL